MEMYVQTKTIYIFAQDIPQFLIQCINNVMIGTTLNIVQVLSPAMTAVSLMYAVNSTLIIGLKERSILSVALCYVLPLITTMTIILWTLVATKENYAASDYPEWAYTNFPNSMY
jgi:uncharacterized membrane protein YkvI